MCHYSHFTVALCCVLLLGLLLTAFHLCSVSRLTAHMIFPVLSWDEEWPWKYFLPLRSQLRLSHGKMLGGMAQRNNMVFFFIKWWELQFCWPLNTRLVPITTICRTHWYCDFSASLLRLVKCELNKEIHGDIVLSCGWSLGWSRRIFSLKAWQRKQNLLTVV